MGRVRFTPEQIIGKSGPIPITTSGRIKPWTILLHMNIIDYGKKLAL